MNQIWSVGLLLTNLLIPPSVIEVVHHPVAVPAYAQAPNLAPSETLEQKIDRMALEHNIASSSLYNLINSESSMNPDVKDGDMSILCGVGVNKGLPVRARGITQITQCYHPEISDSEAYDLDFSINLAAQQIASGTAWKEHTACNCYTYAKTKIHNLPSLNDIQPNSLYPKVGGLIILYYNKTKHVAVIEKVAKEGIYVSESNFYPCSLSKRLIEWEDKNREGYWSPLDK